MSCRIVYIWGHCFWVSGDCSYKRKDQTFEPYFLSIPVGIHRLISHCIYENVRTLGFFGGVSGRRCLIGTYLQVCANYLLQNEIERMRVVDVEARAEIVGGHLAQDLAGDLRGGKALRYMNMGRRPC